LKINSKLLWLKLDFIQKNFKLSYNVSDVVSVRAIFDKRQNIAKKIKM